MRTRHMFAVVFFLAVTLLFGVGCFPGETPEEAYAGYDDALADGAIEHGWVPEWLPETAVNIHEKHDLDRNSSILAFDAGGSFAAPEECEPIGEGAKASLNAEWWPAAEVAGLPVYDCGNGLLAVDRASSQVYFWRP